LEILLAAKFQNASAAHIDFSLDKWNTKFVGFLQRKECVEKLTRRLPFNFGFAIRPHESQA
jgi:hypothetical protein